MKTIKLIVNKLNEMQHDWTNYICDLKKLEDIQNADLKDNIKELLSELREYQKQEDRAALEEIETIIGNKETMKILMDYVNKALIYYNSFSALRKNQTKNEETIEKFIRDAVENYVIRFDRKIILRYSEYGFEDKASMEKALVSLDFLSDYYVKRLFIKENIADDFKGETGFTDNNCQIYAELIDAHFQDIKLNILMRNMETMKDYISKMNHTEN